MLIRVLHNNGSYDYVKPQLLDRLINSRAIISFYRAAGPVILGIDNVRTSSNTEYVGPDRRLAA